MSTRGGRHPTPGALAIDCWINQLGAGGPVEHRLAQRRRGGSPTHPGGPGRFRMRAGHQCRNDGTHVDDVRATPSGSAFQDLRNRRTQMPSTICTTSRVSLSRSRCLHFCAGRHLAAGRRSDAEPRTGWLGLWSTVSRPDQRHGFQFGRRRRGFGCGGGFSLARRSGIRVRGCRVGGGDRGGSGECLAALRAAIPSTRIQTGPVSLTGIKTAGNRQLVVQGNHRQG